MTNPSFLRFLASAGALLCAGSGIATASPTTTDLQSISSNQSSFRSTSALTEEPQPGMEVFVNTTDDHDDGVCGPNDCTFREAITAANIPTGPKWIRFAPKVFESRKTTIVLKSDLPVIRVGLTIFGPTINGAGLTIENPNPTAGYALRVENSSPLVSNLTLKGYNALSFGANEGDFSYFWSCTFLGRSIGVSNTGNLALVNCTTTGSQTTGVITTGSLMMSHNTVAGNKVGVSGGIFLANSLIVGNETNVVAGSSYQEGVSIITGTASEAGLKVDAQGRVVLADNGGPTPTIALLPGSPAIDRGINREGTDQRGVTRQAPDLGAYEIPSTFNWAPTLLSIDPYYVSDKVGTKRTFSITVQDLNGASDVKELWLLINDRLSWDGGATVIYVPSTATPLKGQLFLRSGDKFLAPLDIGVGSRAVVDNGAVSIAARDVTVRVSGTNFTLDMPMTVRDGLIGTNNLYPRVVDKAGALDYNALSGDNGYRRTTTYTVTPQFSDLPSSAPTLSKLTPGGTNTVLSSAGLGPIQNFSFNAADANGIGDLESVWFLAGKTLSWANSATFVYQPRSRRLYLRSDDGNSFLGGTQVGTAGILENSQVRLDLSKARVLTNGDGKTVGLVLPMQAKNGLLGQNKVWLRVQDNQGATAPNGDPQGYVQSGLWNVLPSTASSPSKTTSGASS